MVPRLDGDAPGGAALDASASFSGGYGESVLRCDMAAQGANDASLERIVNSA